MFVDTGETIQSCKIVVFVFSLHYEILHRWIGNLQLFQLIFILKEKRHISRSQNHVLQKKRIKEEIIISLFFESLVLK